MDKASRNPRRFKHYLALLTIISLFLIGCSSTQRFSKEDEGSNSRYERNESYDEETNSKPPMHFTESLLQVVKYIICTILLLLIRHILLIRL